MCDNLISSKSELELNNSQAEDEIKWHKFQSLIHKKENQNEIQDAHNQRIFKTSDAKLTIVLWLLLMNYFCEIVSASPPTPPVISAIHNRVPTGAVIHIFPRYGYLSLSMRVVPRNDSQTWVFLEPVSSN